MKKRVVLALVVFLCLTGFAWADKFYCAVFSQDSKSFPVPHCSHVWGTFIRTDDDGKVTREVTTISWAPKGGWYWTDRVKEGYNMTLEESMDFASDRVVWVWGPVEVNEDFYERAKEQHRASGYYKCIDGVSRRWGHPKAVNCIHRLSDIAGGTRLTTHFRYGKCAGEAVYRHFERRGCVRKTSVADRDRVAKLIGLDKYRLSRSR